MRFQRIRVEARLGAVVAGLIMLAGCAVPEQVKDGTVASIHDRPDPPTGSNMLRRDRRAAGVVVVDKDEMADDIRRNVGAPRGP